MKYLKDLLRISVFVAVMYIPVAWMLMLSTFQSYEEIRGANVTRKIDRVKSTIEEYLLNDRVMESCQLLRAEFAARSIETFTLQADEMSCSSSPEAAVLPPIELRKATSLLFLKKDMLLFYRDQTKKAQWAISYQNANSAGLFQKILTDEILRHSLYRDLALVIYIIFAFVFCAVLILAESIQNQYRRKGKDPMWLKFINATFGKLHLHDLKVIKAASAVLIRKNEELSKDKDLLETSLEYSILHEIRQNNHNIPYQFRGTVAKVDINGFSKVVSAGGKAHNLTRFLEDFGCELLLRYNGLFEKTVGDEIVVVFKSEHSELLAVAFARDLMAEFSKISFDFTGEKRNFTLKSSINSSDILFSKRAPGYGFSGDALTYASRLLDVVNLKDRNVLSLLAPEAQAARELIQIPAEAKKFEFKNMASTSGYLVDQFLSVQEAYQQLPHLMKYFRSDMALSYYLTQIQAEESVAKIDEALNCFRLGTVRTCSEELIAKWIETVRIFERRVVQSPSLSFVFSKLISEGARLIPRNQWSLRCTDAVLSIPRTIDGRINASIIDVLIDKDLNSIAIENENTFILKADQSFRTRGNLIINQGIYELKNSVFDKIISMVQSTNKLESGTGVFCACSLILHYQRTSPAELEIYTSYRKLIEILLKAQQNESVLSPRLHDLLRKTLSQVETKGQEAS